MSSKAILSAFLCIAASLLVSGHVIHQGDISDLLANTIPVQAKDLPLNDNVTYYSYHIHVYFLQKNENATNEATLLRNRFLSKFNVDSCNDDCETWCPKICHWDLNMAPIGYERTPSFSRLCARVRL